MLYIVLILIVIIAYYASLVRAYQLTTLAIGRLLIGKSGADKGTGVQDAITPKVQTFRNIILYILLIMLFVLVTFVYTWYYGIISIVVCFLIVTPIISAVFRIDPAKPKFILSIKRDMMNRHDKYQRTNDVIRAKAIQELIDKLEEIPSELIYKEANK